MTDTFINKILADNPQTREEFAAALGRTGIRKCAEIGVLRGGYSEVLCRAIPDIELYCIDPWTPSRNHRNQGRLEGHYIRAQRRLKYFNVTFLRMTSVEAAKIVPDNSLEMVYIDALHDYENVKADINAWVPKVVKGGIVSGHDWLHAGVARAVEEYAAAHGITPIHTTKELPEVIYPSWFWENR
jgi:predicted O-methyltransferase YrrM